MGARDGRWDMADAASALASAAGSGSTAGGCAAAGVYSRRLVVGVGAASSIVMLVSLSKREDTSRS